MLGYQSSSFGSIRGDVFAGGIQVLPASTTSAAGSSSLSVYVTATVSGDFCVLQELDLATLKPRNGNDDGSETATTAILPGFPLPGETCTALLPGLRSGEGQDVRTLLLLGNHAPKLDQFPHNAKAAVYYLGGNGQQEGFNDQQTVVKEQWTYPVGVSFSRDYRTMELLLYVPASDDLSSSTNDVKYPESWSPFVVAPPFASAFQVIQVNSDVFENEVWSKRFAAHHAQDATISLPVMPAGIFSHPVTEVLYIAGSTAGIGDAFGPAEEAEDDMDGFIVRLNSKSGELEPMASSESDSSRRIGTAGHDYIISHCSPVEDTWLMEHGTFQNTDLNLADSWYIVGATSSSFRSPDEKFVQGDGSTPFYRAFISKIDLNTLEETWTVEFFPNNTGNATATKCVVDPATNVVYITGTSTGQLEAESLDGQAGIQGNIDGAGGGLFVSRVNGAGTVQWIQQFGSGSTGEDADRVTDLTLVPSDAVLSSTTVKDAARVLVVGHTKGGVIEENVDPSTTEMFVVALDAKSGHILGAGDQMTDPAVDELMPDSIPTLEPTDPPATTDPPTTEPTPPPTEPITNSPTEMPVPEPTGPPTPPPTDFPSQPPSESLTDFPTHQPTDKPDPHADGVITSDGSGFQSNWGPSYAGAMVYDFTRHSIYLTGSTYANPHHKQSTCFLGHLPLSSMQHWRTEQDPVTDGLDPDIEKEENLACRSMAHNADYLWVGGMREKKGTDRNCPQNGFYTLYTRNHRHPNWAILAAKIVEAKPENVKVQLPDAMVVLPMSNELFMAMVSSNDDQLTPEHYKNEDKDEYPNLTAGSDFLKRGFGYYITVQVFKIETGNDGPFPSFSRSGVIEAGKKNVFVSGIRVMEGKNQIVLVGSIQGKNGENFNPEGDRNDMDGFAVQVEPAGVTFLDTIHFNSIGNKDDFVHNVCDSPDGETFFVVGSTMGSMVNATMYGASDSSTIMSAFVSKVLFDTREILWTTQFNPLSGPTSGARAEAFGCHVIPHDPSLMYAGGVVYDGGSMNNQLKSAGSDDLFVAQIDTSDGTVRWMRQIGSSGKENMARNNGVFADLEGDCLLYGDTTGALYRPRHDKSTTSDVFVVKLSQVDGTFAKTLEMNRSLHIVIAFVGLVFLVCVAFGFYRRGKCFEMLRKRAPKKDVDYEMNDSIFKDDPSAENGKYRNGKSQYKDTVSDDDPEIDPSYPMGALELSMMPASQPYRDEPTRRRGKRIV